MTSRASAPRAARVAAVPVAPGVVLAAVLAVLAGLLAACGGPSRTSEVVQGDAASQVAGNRVSVLLPTGRLELTIGSTVDQISSAQSQDGESHRPPEGGHFVPVRWRFDPFAFSGTYRGAMSRLPKPATVVVRTGGRTLPLGAPYHVAGSQGALSNTGPFVSYVPVTGTGDLRVAVTYDGLTQTVGADGSRRAGAAAPLYHAHHPRHLPCRRTGWRGVGRADLDCRVGPAVSLPYLPGHGWAKAGRTWLLVPFSANVAGVRIHGRTWTPGPVTARATLAHAKPVPGGLFVTDAAAVGRVDRTFVYDARAGWRAGHGSGHGSGHRSVLHVRLHTPLVSPTAALKHRTVVLRQSFRLR